MNFQAAFFVPFFQIHRKGGGSHVGDSTANVI